MLQLNKKYRRHHYIWLSISILFALYFALVSLHYAFSQDYIIQDDVRIHIVWLQKFIDPELFPDNFLADYFIYFAPWGFKGVYWLGAKIGLEPLILAKLLPGVLGLITAVYVYFLSLEILPKPFCAFLSSLFITQLIWLNDDLISATPRAFIYPLFAAFLYYLAKQQLIPCLLVMFVQGLFYPQVLLVEMTILTLRVLGVKRKKFFQLTKGKQPYRWFILGLIGTAIAFVPFSQRSPEWSRVVTNLEMQQLPEFNLYGRSYFYGVGWLKFIFAGDSGLCLPKFPPIVWAGFVFPWLLNKPLTTIKLITEKINILWQVVIASLLMFATAHLLLLKIHLPSRYTYHSLRLVLAIAYAIVVTTLLEIGIHWLRQKKVFKLSEKITITLITLFAINVIVFPMIPHVFINWFQNWRVGETPAVYQYLAEQPKDIIVASLSNDANNIPAFAHRSILVGEEFAFPYHPYYHQQIQQRAKDLITAQYTSEKETLLSFINRYSIDFILLDKTAFTPEYLQDKSWLVYSSWQNTTQKALKKFNNTNSFVLPSLIQSCSVVSTQQSYLLNTKCMINKIRSSEIR